MAPRVTDDHMIATAHNWARSLSHPSQPADFAALYSSDGMHIEHCHFYKQVGTAEVETLHRVWLRAIPDCKMTIPRVDILADDEEGHRRCSWLYNCTGTFKADLSRTKATGDSFEYLAKVDCVFDDQGKIKRADEWMSTRFFTQPGGDYFTLKF